MRIEPGGTLAGELALPGDKSISHRYALLGAMAAGETSIRHYSPSEDCGAMLACLQRLGAEIVRSNDAVKVRSPGWQRWTRPAGPLDAANSGTAMRLLAGPLAGVSFESELTGDASLQARPMARIITPLTRMGASVSARDGGLPPLRIDGRPLHGIEFIPPQASAQVKSCLLLAGLVAEGRTVVVESRPTRDHTERALPAFGVDLSASDGRLEVSGPARLEPAEMTVPGDQSAAVYFLAAALLLDGSEVRLRQVGCNPSRSGLLVLLEQAGAAITRDAPVEHNGEPASDLCVRGAGRDFLAGLPAEIPPELIPNVIDELPLIALMASLGPRGLLLRGASELRHKETDRIQAVVANLRALGARVAEFDDGLEVAGNQNLQGGRVRTWGDHRIAMTFAVAGLLSRDGVVLDDPGCVAVSHPNFFADLESLRRDR